MTQFRCASVYLFWVFFGFLLNGLLLRFEDTQIAVDVII